MPHHAVTIVTSLLLGLAVSVPAHARITRIDIEKVESPTFDGAPFGNSGPYEKLTGKAYGELDPAHELNRNVVLLDKAPRNAAGRVEYSIDILILKPVDMSRGNRTLIYDSVNRGNLRAIQVFNILGDPTGNPANPGDAATSDGVANNNPSRLRDAGDGFLFRQGYTIVASGWPGDVLPGGDRLTGRFPVATEPDGKPITKLITLALVFTKPAYSISVGYDGAQYAPLSGGHGARGRGAALSPRRLFSAARDDPAGRVVVRQVPRRQERCRERRRCVLPGRLLA